MYIHVDYKLITFSCTTQKFDDFETIMNLMNQDDFRQLFDTQFQEFSEIKSVLLIMKTYSYLENLYNREKGEKPSKDYMSAGIRKLMRNHDTRRFLVDSTIAFMKDEDTFEKLLKKISTKLFCRKTPIHSLKTLHIHYNHVCSGSHVNWSIRT